MAGYQTSGHAKHVIRRYHLAWITKRGCRALRGDVAERARELIRQACEMREVQIVRGEVSADHVQLLVSAPPQLVQSIKERSSKRLQEDFPHLKQRCWGGRPWARGCFRRTVGAVNGDAVRECIESHQWDPDGEGFQAVAPESPRAAPAGRSTDGLSRPPDSRSRSNPPTLSRWSPGRSRHACPHFPFQVSPVDPHKTCVPIEGAVPNLWERPTSSGRPDRLKTLAGPSKDRRGTGSKPQTAARRRAGSSVQVTQQECLPVRCSACPERFNKDAVDERQHADSYRRQERSRRILDYVFEGLGSFGKQVQRPGPKEDPPGQGVAQREDSVARVVTRRPNRNRAVDEARKWNCQNGGGLDSKQWGGHGSSGSGTSLTSIPNGNATSTPTSRIAGGAARD